MENTSLAPLHHAIRHWYAQHGRTDLPWRQTSAPYPIYISEIMLQQTQVKTVLERFYTPFLKRFPTLEALAKAEEADVLKAWEGLGYYTRARNLHRAARLAAPRLPQDYAGLIALPGIGKSTAHAILAFAWHKPYAVLDANVKRVLHRLSALPERNEKALWAVAEQYLDREQPYLYNQAMMDIGALICLPKTPLCTACPLAPYCAGKADPLAYPQPKLRKRVPVRRITVVALRDANGRYYLTPRRTAFLGGLYGFIELAEAEQSFSAAGQKYSLSDAIFAGNASQQYSHFKADANLYQLQLADAKNTPEWFSPDEIKTLALSRLDHKLLALLQL